MDKISRGFNFADDENFQFRVDLISRLANFFFISNQLFFVMKVINYTALKKNLGQYLQAKSRRKKPQTHQIQEIFDFFC